MTPDESFSVILRITDTVGLQCLLLTIHKAWNGWPDKIISKMINTYIDFRFVGLRQVAVGVVCTDLRIM